MRCARCDHRADSLTEHAVDSGHLLCIVCQRRSLGEFERQTCAGCVADVRADLDLVGRLHARLDVDGWLSASLPTLSLAAAGTGSYPVGRRLRGHPADAAVVDYPAWPATANRPHPAWRRGVSSTHVGWEHAADCWAGADAPSVLGVLVREEDDWRAEFGHGPAHGGTVRGDATVAGCLGYLRRWFDLAAQTHPGFDSFAAEIRQLRSRLEWTLGEVDAPKVSPAECFDCGGTLLRAYRPLTLPVQARMRAAAAWIARGEPARARASLAGSDVEGLADDWTCARKACGRVYDQESYLLALRAHVAEQVADWRPVSVAAWLVDRPFRTVQAWMATGTVDSCRREGDGRNVVWMPDVVAASKAAARQPRKAVGQ